MPTTHQVAVHAPQRLPLWGSWHGLAVTERANPHHRSHTSSHCTHQRLSLWERLLHRSKAPPLGELASEARLRGRCAVSMTHQVAMYVISLTFYFTLWTSILYILCQTVQNRYCLFALSVTLTGATSPKGRGFCTAPRLPRRGSWLARYEPD